MWGVQGSQRGKPRYEKQHLGNVATLWGGRYSGLKVTQGINRGAWVAQSVKRPTPGFSLAHDLTVHEFEPRIRLHPDRAEPGCDSLSAPPLLPLSVTKINK